jgi:DNA-binding IclR family transcriptional regulator
MALTGGEASSSIFDVSIAYSNRIHPQRESATAVRSLTTAVKALALLDHLGTRERPTRLAELVADLGGGRSTIYQRLVTLIEAGWVEQTEDGRFRLTMRAMKVAGAALEQAGLGDRALPLLRELVAEVGETASLAVIQDRVAIIIQRVESGGVLQARAPLGTAMSLDNSASGRVLIAFANEEKVRSLKGASVSLPEEKVLREVRRRGVGVVARHIEVGAVAAPVFDHRQCCVAALSLVGPRGRFDIDRMSGPVLAAARKLSSMLGGRPWSPLPASVKAGQSSKIGKA